MCQNAREMHHFEAKKSKKFLTAPYPDPSPLGGGHPSPNPTSSVRILSMTKLLLKWCKYWNWTEIILKWLSSNFIETKTEMILRTGISRVSTLYKTSTAVSKMWFKVYEALTISTAYPRFIMLFKKQKSLQDNNRNYWAIIQCNNRFCHNFLLLKSTSIKLWHFSQFSSFLYFHKWDEFLFINYRLLVELTQHLIITTVAVITTVAAFRLCSLQTHLLMQCFRSRNWYRRVLWQQQIITVIY